MEGKSVVNSVAAVGNLEKGGLFVILLVVLYMGYNIYLSNNGREKTIVADRLGVIAQQQLNLQSSLTNVQNTANVNRDDTRSILAKIDGIEKTMIRYVHVSGNELILRTPDADGGRTLRVKVIPEDKN